MKEEIRKEVLYHISEVMNIFSKETGKNREQLVTLSNHAVEDVALYKDLDIISVTVLLYALSKVIQVMNGKDKKEFLEELKKTKQHLQGKKFRGYNKGIKNLYAIVRRSNTRIKTHLQDVMQAARIKKGTTLLEHGLSIGQAAGLMGLSNWDLQEYAGKNIPLSEHTESRPASRRLQKAMRIFNV